MIKVLQITPSLDYGGVSQFLMHYYDIMDKNKICFDFITHEGVEDFHARLAEQGSKIYYFRREGETGLVKYYKQYRDANIRKYDIVHIHLGHYTGLVAMVCKLMGAKKVICHAHTTKCMNGKHLKLMPVFRILARMFSNGLFSCGEKAGEFCFGKTNFTIIPNGVDLNVFKHAGDKEVALLKKELGIPLDSWVIGCVANFGPPKNLFYLLKVFERCLMINSRSRLLLVGDGVLRQELVKVITEKGLSRYVVLPGIQRNIPLYLSVFDVFALTSIHEGFPVVAAEAQAVGVKCVYSDNIDKTCDLGLGLMKFLPIGDSDIDEWAKECLFEYRRVSNDEIAKAYKERRFEIYSGAEFLSQCYMKLVSKR